MEERLNPLPIPAAVSDTRATDAEADRREAKRRRYVGHHLKNAAGPRLARCRLENYQAKRQEQTHVLASVEEWAATFADRKKSVEGLVLYGPVGTGKDHLVFGACWKVVCTHPVTVRWINGRDLFGLFRDRMDSQTTEKETIGELVAPDVLILSDPLPTTGALSAWQADCLYRLIESRWRQGKMICVTANVAGDDEAGERFGEATWDRICDRAWKAFCYWPSYRQPSRVIA